MKYTLRFKEKFLITLAAKIVKFVISNVAYIIYKTLYKTGVKCEFSVFFQEIFTEQVVAYHAVRVPVTPNLSSKITGFLPVHCIHQLLKCRAFSKHKVPIKDWIYK